MKRISIILTIIAALLLVGCGSTVEPLAKVGLGPANPPALPEPEVVQELKVIEHKPVGEKPEKTSEYVSVAKTAPVTVFNEFGSFKEFLLVVGFLHEDTNRPENDLRNVSYVDVLRFLAEDKTDEIEHTGEKSEVYPGQEWMCADYAATVRKNANEEGIRSAVAVLYLATVGNPARVETTHAIVAFETTDKGLMYFEPQGDEEAGVLREGQFYPEPPNTAFKIHDDYGVTNKVVLLW